MNNVREGDFVEVSPHVKDKELKSLGFNDRDIKLLKNGEFVAGSYLNLGAKDGRGGRFLARPMFPGGKCVPIWKIETYSGVILLVPEHIITASDGPKPYHIKELGREFYLEQGVEDILNFDSEGLWGESL